MIRHLLIWTRLHPSSLINPAIAFFTLGAPAFITAAVTQEPIWYVSAVLIVVLWPSAIWLTEFGWYHRGLQTGAARSLHDMFADLDRARAEADADDQA